MPGGPRPCTEQLDPRELQVNACEHHVVGRQHISAFPEELRAERCAIAHSLCRAEHPAASHHPKHVLIVTRPACVLKKDETRPMYAWPFNASFRALMREEFVSLHRSARHATGDRRLRPWTPLNRGRFVARRWFTPLVHHDLCDICNRRDLVQFLPRRSGLHIRWCSRLLQCVGGSPTIERWLPVSSLPWLSSLSADALRTFRGH
jgi:hypothetical protein